MRYLIVSLLLLVAGCTGGKPVAPESASPTNRQDVVEPVRRDPEAETYAFRCPDGYKFTAILGREVALLMFSDGEAKLQRRRSASGVKYRGQDVMFWLNDDAAILERGSKERKGCIVDWKATVWEEAKVMGVDFRAVGNEPGWRMDIYGEERMVLVTNYGRKRYEFPYVMPEVDRSARIMTYETRNEDHQLRVTIEGRRCADSMSGDAYPNSVSVVLDGKMLKGCGRALR